MALTATLGFMAKGIDAALGAQMCIGAGLKVIVVTTGSAGLEITGWSRFMFTRRTCRKISRGALAFWSRSAVVKLSGWALSLRTVAVSGWTLT